MELKILSVDFSVSKLIDTSLVRWDDEFVFLSKTDDEISLVCASEHVPANATQIENGWRAYKINGVLDFSLVGILATIATILAKSGISIFAISTFNTDYILVKADKFNLATNILQAKGYEICK